MTLAELQNARTKIYAQYIAWIDAGCPKSMMIGGRSFQSVDENFWLKQMDALDLRIGAQTGAGCFVMQARPPE